jgi:uncharacterized membrane protein YedE/YeeE
VSSNLRHLCSAIAPRGIPYLTYDWRREGGWNLAFVAGIVVGGLLAGLVFANPSRSPSPRRRVRRSRRSAFTSSPVSCRASCSHGRALATVRGWIVIVGGGFLVGFGTAYAGGCTSGHGISGVANLETPSFIALGGFFAGGTARHLRASAARARAALMRHRSSRASTSSWTTTIVHELSASATRDPSAPGSGSISSPARCSASC